MSGQAVYVENGEENQLLLENLPTDVIYIIFKYCDLACLGRLSTMCKRFNNIINEDFIWLEKGRNALVTNQTTSEIRNRSPYNLLSKEKCRISINWKRGKYKERICFLQKTKYMPWIVLDKNILWMTKGNWIKAYKRNKDRIVTNSSLMTLKAHTDDVCRFVIKNGILISGGRDGAICGWSSNSGQLLFCHWYCHSSDVNSVDMKGHLLVSGSRDQMVKVWNLADQRYKSREPILMLNLGDRIWSVAMSPYGDWCCVGSAGHHQVSPLHLYNLQQEVEMKTFNSIYKCGAGVLDIHWESPHTLLSTGYDTFIRLWDIRTGGNVFTWEDPHDSAIYCLQSDNLNTMVTGTARHGRVQLWDKRMRKGIQMYFMAGSCSSPVYSLAFDPCQLFAALDQSLNILNFSGFKNRAISYM